MPERLQGECPCVVPAGVLRLRQVDPAVLQVHHGPRRLRQVVDPHQREAEMRGKVVERPLGQRALTGDDGRAARPRRARSPRSSCRARASPGGAPRWRVGPPPGWRRARSAWRASSRVQPDERLEDLGRAAAAPGRTIGSPSPAYDGPPLRPLQSDLQRGTPARRLGTEQVRRGHPERGGQRLEHREPRLPMTVLQQRQLGGRPADEDAQRLEGQSPGPAQSAGSAGPG